MEPLTYTTESVAFGHLLRVARERRGLTLQQISHETKIPKRHLEALERGRLSAVPSGAYRRGEVVAFAKVVGLDRALTLQELDHALETFEPHEPEEVLARRAGTRRRPGALSLAAVSLAIAVAIGLAIWGARTDSAMAVEGSAATGSGGSAASAAPAVVDAMSSDAVSRAGRVDDTGPPAAEPPRSVARTRPSLSAVTQAPPESVPRVAEATADTVAARPVAARSDVRLVIVTEPPGARVTVDGIGWGTTPLSLRNVPSGARQIRVTKDGFAAATRVARVTDGRTTTLSIDLRQP